MVKNESFTVVTAEEILSLPDGNISKHQEPDFKSFRSGYIHKFKRKSIREFGTWVVTDYGLINTIGPYLYRISKNRLSESGWCVHMRGKVWVNTRDFEQALLWARNYFNIVEPKYGDWKHPI